MNEYALIYNEYGLMEMIKDNQNKIMEKQKEFHEKHKFFCEDELIKVILEDIQCYENEIVELEEALKFQRNKSNNIKNNKN